MTKKSEPEMIANAIRLTEGEVVDLSYALGKKHAKSMTGPKRTAHLGMMHRKTSNLRTRATAEYQKSGPSQKHQELDAQAKRYESYLKGWKEHE